MIVPGWGAFIAHYTPAHVDGSGDMLMPPGRSVSFNPAISHNDGLLATSVARATGMSYDTALGAVEAEVEALRRQLELSGEIVIPRVGTFTAGDEGTVLFEPARDCIASARYRGLPALPLVALEQDMAPDTETTEEPRTLRVPLLRHFFKGAASVAVLIGLGITLSTPVIVDREKLNYASLSATDMVRTATPAEEADIPAADAAGYELWVAGNADGAVTVDTVKAVTPAGGVKADQRRYYLIVASLPSRRLAEQQLAEMKDPSLAILERDGRFRLYAAEGSTYEEAQRPMADRSFAARYPNAWVCHR